MLRYLFDGGKKGDGFHLIKIYPQGRGVNSENDSSVCVFM